MGPDPRAIDDIPGVRLAFPVESNSVFLHASDALLAGLAGRGWRFYTFIGGSARFMFAWDAIEDRVDQLAHDIRLLATGFESGIRQAKEAALDNCAGAPISPA